MRKMAKGKKHTPGQIVSLLRQIEVGGGQVLKSEGERGADSVLLLLTLFPDHPKIPQILSPAFHIRDCTSCTFLAVLRHPKRPIIAEFGFEPFPRTRSVG